MRHWLLHPLVFYPLAFVAALLLIAASIKPQNWPRPAAAAAGAAAADGALVLEADALGAPEPGPAQTLFVERNLWGQAEALRIAIQPGQGAPGPADPGVRILLAPEASARVSGRPLVAEVSYNPLPINAATALALSLQGQEAHTWVITPLPPQPGVARFVLPATANVAALGLRAISDGQGQAYGVEITRIRLAPHPAGGAAN